MITKKANTRHQAAGMRHAMGFKALSPRAVRILERVAGGEECVDASDCTRTERKMIAVELKWDLTCAFVWGWIDG